MTMAVEVRPGGGGHGETVSVISMWRLSGSGGGDGNVARVIEVKDIVVTMVAGGGSIKDGGHDGDDVETVENEEVEAMTTMVVAYMILFFY